MQTKNTIKTRQEGCVESWGIPLSKSLPDTLHAQVGFSSKAEPKTTQNTSKNKALLDFAFVARSTFRTDSDFSGEQAHV